MGRCLILGAASKGVLSVASTAGGDCLVRSLLVVNAAGGDCLVRSLLVVSAAGGDWPFLPGPPSSFLERREWPHTSYDGGISASPQDL